jgi:hypothetical protein
MFTGLAKWYIVHLTQKGSPNIDVIGFEVLGEVGWGDVDWIGLAKDRNRWRAVVNSVLNL